MIGKPGITFFRAQHPRPFEASRIGFPAMAADITCAREAYGHEKAPEITI
jgi:hypothetical protein